jgi:VWFA-related protein
MPRTSVVIRIGAVVTVCVLSFTVGIARQAPPTFKSSVEAVVLDVSVLDKDRRPVRGLTAADFTILEDGKPQGIGTFKAVDLEDVVDATDAPWTREVTADIRRNDDFRERRIVVIVMDSSTPMPAPEALQAKRLGRSVVEGLAPDDLAAVVYTFGKSYGQLFTHDKAKLMAAVDRFNGTPGGDVAFNQFDATGSTLTLYHSTISTLRGIAEDLIAMPDRRKALFFVSVGIPLDAAAATEPGSNGRVDSSGQLAVLFDELKKTFDAARRSNVSIYGVDPGGLRSVAASLNQDFLKGVSAATAGFVITDTNDPAPGIKQIYRENSSYYLLGYQPSSSRANGLFRKVEIKVNRPGVTVRSRSGYFEPTREKATSKPVSLAAATSPAIAALEGIVPKSDIALRVHTVPFANRAGSESDVAIVLQGREPIPSGSKATAETLTLLVHAYDLQARLKASERLTVRVGLRPGAVSDLRYGLLSSLTLRPGRYQLRLAATSSLLGKSGSVYAEIEVPDYSKAALSLSPVMLEAMPSPITVPKGRLASLIPIVPTAERDFMTGDTVTAFARIYQGGKGALQDVSVTTRIVDRVGAEVFIKKETASATRFGDRRSSDVLVPMPIATLAPGPHLLSVVITRGTVSARQDVRFTLHGSGGR